MSSAAADEKNPSTTNNNEVKQDPPANSSVAIKKPPKMLSAEDLREVCQKIGAPPSMWPFTESPSGSGHESPSKAQSYRAPTPKDAPRGLYKDVISARKMAQYNYYFTATLYNSCIVLQLLFGAALTALGSTTNADGHGLSITLLAAFNTVNAGLIALLHNSGLPNRCKQDWNEYAKVEMYLEELVYTGLVGGDDTKVDAVARCWDLFVSEHPPAFFLGGWLWRGGE